MLEVSTPSLRVSLILACAIAAGALSLASGPPAHATEVQLDTYNAGNASEVSVVGQVLEDGQPYLITVQGSFSFWFASDWQTFGPCDGGVPPAMPVFPSPGTQNGPVSHDAAWYFGGPDGLSDCDDPLPDPSDPLGISLDGGNNWDDLEVDDVGGAPDPNHAYHLTVIGQGAPVVFGLLDEKTVDNYGIFKFTIEPAVIWADLDCSGQVELAGDTLKGLWELAGIGLTAAGNSCHSLDDTIFTQEYGELTWGNLDCDGTVDANDIILIVKQEAGLVAEVHDECPIIAETVPLSDV